MTSPARVQEAEELVRDWYHRFIPPTRIEDYCADELGQALIHAIAAALTAATQAERRRIIALAREYGTESTVALANHLQAEGETA